MLVYKWISQMSMLCRSQGFDSFPLRHCLSRIPAAAQSRQAPLKVQPHHISEMQIWQKVSHCQGTCGLALSDVSCRGSLAQRAASVDLATLRGVAVCRYQDLPLPSSLTTIQPPLLPSYQSRGCVKLMETFEGGQFSYAVMELLGVIRPVGVFGWVKKMDRYIQIQQSTISHSPNISPFGGP